MQKKILIVTGSPRKQGNSAAMAEAFACGAKKNGHEVERFDAAFQPIAGCAACDRCWENGQACCRQDAWQVFAGQLEKADVVVFAYPLYWSTMPAQIKAAIDRLYSYCSPKALRTLAGKKIVLLLCGECAGQQIFREALSVHEGINRYFDWETVGMVTVDGVFECGAIKKTDALIRAEQLGASM